MRKWLIVSLALALPAWPLSLPAQAAGEKPAISVRLETPRDFGYHIGDLVPLVLLIEAEAGVVIDLETLPHRGEAVGRFEVRNVRIDRSRIARGSATRVAFILQSFVPATSDPRVTFPPLDLRFALPEDRSADGRYAYRTVTLPPYVFSFSPTAGGAGALRPPKGSVVPQTGWPFWTLVSLGVGFLALGLLRLVWDGARWWQQRSRAARSQAERRALRALKVLRERCLACNEETPYLFLKVSGVLRRFLTEECGIPARAQTIPQIRERFGGHPLEREVEEVLERCNRVLYDGHHPTASERDAILREVTGLIDRLEQVGCPIDGGNGATR